MRIEEKKQDTRILSREIYGCPYHSFKLLFIQAGLIEVVSFTITSKKIVQVIGRYLWQSPAEC